MKALQQMEEERQKHIKARTKPTHRIGEELPEEDEAGFLECHLVYCCAHTWSQDSLFGFSKIVRGLPKRYVKKNFLRNLILTCSSTYAFIMGAA